MAGTITTSAIHTGSFIGGSTNSAENIRLTRCHSSVTMITSKEGDNSSGGLLGVVKGGSAFLTDCVFSGSFQPQGNTAPNNFGGMVGYTNRIAKNTFHMFRCLLVGTIIVGAHSSEYSAPMVRFNYNDTFDNLFDDCYFRKDWKTLLNQNMKHAGNNCGIRATAAQLESGEICWALNQESPDGIWRQELGRDPYPILDLTDQLPKVSLTPDGGFINIFPLPLYNISCTKAGAYMGDSPVSSAHAGDIVTLVPETVEGLRFFAWKFTDDDDVRLEISVNDQNQFTMPEHNIQVEALYTQILPNVPYVDENGELQGRDSYVVLIPDSGLQALDSGWYVLRGGSAEAPIVFLNGFELADGAQVHLIVADDAHIRIENAIRVGHRNNVLTIYGQEKGNGDLDVEPIDFGLRCSSIGNPDDMDCGHIIINGGAVMAPLGQTYNRIGGDRCKLTINGGVVQAFTITDVLFDGPHIDLQPSTPREGNSPVADFEDASDAGAEGLFHRRRLCGV